MDAAARDRELVSLALAEATAGGLEAEAYLVEVEEARVEVRKGEPEARVHAVRRGLGLRVEREQRVGVAHTTALDPEGLAVAARRARDAWEVAEPRPAETLPSPTEGEADASTSYYDEEVDLLDAPARLDRALRAEAAAFAHDPRVRTMESSIWHDLRERRTLASSRGVVMQERTSLASCSVALVAREGEEERTGYHSVVARGPGGCDPEEVGGRAAQRAVALLGSRQMPTARVPVLLEPEVGAALLDLLAGPLSAESCLAGTSMLAERLGEAVASATVTLVDDPRDPRGVGGARWDDEGVPQRRTPVIEGGILRTHLHNTLTARRTGVASTGNAARAGFAGRVGVAPSNLVLEPGTRTRDELIASLGRGVVVQEVMGLHMANTVSGDFSLGIVGHWIEGGEASCPIEEMTVAGNLLDLWGAIVELGSDLRFQGDVASPSVLVDGLTVSGS